MPPVISENNLEWLGRYRVELDQCIVRFFDDRYTGTQHTPAEKVFEEAMRHAVLGGGKRLRPILAMLAYEELTGQSSTPFLPGLIGIEFLHCYTLVHDDLPCMDNDTLRRWQPTVWHKYGEYTAILVGDALQSLGFETLACLNNSEIIAKIAQAMGDLGVVRGQIKDMRANEYQDSLASLLGLHEQKTGVFIQTSLEIGAILAQASPEILSDLREYGASIGLLFQIQDDILDYESTPDAVGKTVRKDLDQNKGIIHRIGIERARIIRQETLTKALYQAQKLQSDRLLAIAYFIAQRTH